MIEIKIKNQSPQQNDVILGPDCNGGLSRTHKWTQGSDVEYKISFKSYQNNTWTYHVERTDGNKKLDEVYFKMPTSCSENNIVTTTPTKDSFHNQKLLWDLHGNSSSGDFSFQLDGNYPAGTLEARIEPKDKGSQYFGIMGPANCDTEVTLPGNNDNSGGGGSGGVDSHSVTTSCTVANDDGQKMTICHLPDGHPENAHTIEISKSAWPAHMLAGDTVGACLKDHQDQLDGNDKKVTICHYPPGNPGNAHEITISKNALQKHLDHHNDTIGECDSGPTVVCPEPQIVGLRFQYVDIPKGATIKKASIDFKSAAAADGNATFTIKAENSGNAEAFVAETGNISDRNTFADSVTWDVGSWDSETSYSTPDLAPLVENIVGHANWCGGKNLAFIISGSSDALHRVWSYDGDPNAAPKLNVEFESPTDTSGGNGCINQNYFGKIVHQDDDAEETSIGDVYVTTANNALDLGSDDDGASRTVGFRFRNVPIRKDATIVGAHLILHAQAGDNSDNASFDITGELEPNSEPFAEVDYNVTSRLNKPTSAVVNWPVATPWDDNKSYQSPDIKAIVQELVQQADWNASTNSMTLVLTGTGQRKVFSYEGGSATAATLHIQIDGYLGDNNTRTYLKEQVQNMIPGGWTPIVNALYESAIYFRGGEVTYGLDRQNQSKHLVSHPDTYTHVAPLDADTPKFYRDPACHFETDMFHYKCKTEKITVTASSKPFYNSPIATSNSPCQSNHIVLLTDGQATRNDAVANVENMIGSCATDVFNETPNEKCGIELAKFLYENDQYDDPDDTSDDNADKFRNNVTVHTIGFALKQQHPVDYLKKIAEVGGGSFHEADDVVKLQEAFTSIVVSAMEESTSFAPAGISLNRYNRLVHNNEVYYALFKPAMTQTWRGNVKKYKFAKVDVSTENSQWCDKNTKAAEGEILCLVDQNEKVAVKEQYINPDAQSFWSPNVDGANVVKGGAGEVLLNQTTRHILTDLGTPAGTALVDLPSDLVQLENAGLTGTDTNTETLRNWILGTDENNNPRNWLMSEPLHSSPQAMSYKAAEVDADGNVVTPVVSKVFFGANDGMLRMIDSETGQEEWAFLPQELFGIQAELMANGNDFTGESHIYGIDGTPVFWVNDQDGTITPSGGDDFVRLYVGMRRGGRNIYALDVTGTDASPGSDPRLMWVIKGGQGDFVNLGQTWSSVQPKKVHPSYCSKVDNALLEKDGSCVVLLFGGGYDEAQDDDANFGTPSSKGNAIYMVHAATGQRLWWASSASDATKQLSHMDYPIPAKLTVLDINGDSWVDRIYVGDVAGQVWRVDLLGWGLDENHQYQDLTLADRLAVVSSADESNYPIVSATGNGKRRFFASAEWIKTAVGDVVAIGSGTRPNPRNEEVTDRFYVFLDEGWQIDPNTGENLGTLNTLGETDLVNMTTTLELAAKSVLPGPDGEKGWYIEFTDSGEKALGNSVIIKKGDTEIVFFTTYAPPQEVAGQCDFQAGKSKLYALNLLTSAPAYDKDDNGNADTDNKGNDLADRSFDLKGGMPSDISLLYTDNEVSPLVGTERFVGDNDRQVKQTFWLQDE
jgi:type IV pilus assembly protein PilY1